MLIRAAARRCLKNTFNSRKATDPALEDELSCTWVIRRVRARARNSSLAVARQERRGGGGN